MFVFSTITDISGVIFIYTWDTFLHPVYVKDKTQKEITNKHTYKHL